MKVYFSLCILLAQCCWVHIASAYQLQAINLEQMAQGAGDIFYAQVTKVQKGSQFVMHGKLPYIQVHFSIKDSLKGTSTSEKIVKLAARKNAKGEYVPLAGNPHHYVGQELVAFYTKPSSGMGLSSPIAFQGLFGIKKTEKSDAFYVYNLVTKGECFKNLQNPAVLSLLQSNYSMIELQTTGMIRYKDFKKIVELSQ
ncbi:MAG: hypothetical protein KDD52_06515 [Bdellovibrionales bacterium]|nr:hypothetical protein [Bdellovibrionales bacterium]